MNTYYETFLRQDIFPNNDEKCDIVIEIYNANEVERHYISMVIEDYINGGSSYQARKRLERNVVDVYYRLQKKGAYLDEEYKTKMERRA